MAKYYSSKHDDRDVSPERRRYSSASKSSRGDFSLSLTRPEKTFHLAVHDALQEWKTDLEETHERELERMQEKHERELRKMRDKMMASVEEDKVRVIEEMSRKDQSEIAQLKKEIKALKLGWSKERKQWQATKQNLEKDLDPTSWLF